MDREGQAVQPQHHHFRNTFMHRAQLSILALLLLLASCVQAQYDTLWVFRDNATFMHSLQSKSERYPALTVYAGLGTTTRPLGEAEFTGGVQARYTLAGIAAFQLRADHHLSKSFDTQYRWLEDNPDIRTSNEMRPYTYLELGGSIGLNKSKKMAVELPVRSTGPYGKRRVKKLDKNLLGTVQYAGRLGAMRYTSLVNNYLLDSDALVDANGTILYTGGPIDLRHRDPGPTFITSFSTTGVYLGAAISWWRHARYTVSNEYRKLETTTNRADKITLFADAIPFSGISMDDMVIDGTPYNVQHSNGGGFEYRAAGWRVGFEVEAIRGDHHGFAFQLEAGMRPGISNNAYDVPPFGKKVYANTRVLYVFGK